MGQDTWKYVGFGPDVPCGYSLKTYFGYDVNKGESTNSKSISNSKFN